MSSLLLDERYMVCYDIVCMINTLRVCVFYCNKSSQVYEKTCITFYLVVIIPARITPR